MSETVALQALCGETDLEDALGSWQGFVRLADEELALPPDLRLAPGAPVDPGSFVAEHCFVGPIRPIGCYFLGNVTFAGVLYPFRDGRLIDDGSYLSMLCASWLANFPTHRPGMRGNLPPTNIDAMVLPVAGPGHQAYGHWIIDFLPRLAIAREVLGYRFRDLRFLVLRDTPAWAFALMEAFFGIHERDCIRFDLGNDEFLCPHVVYPSYASTYPFLLHSFIERFYRPYAARQPGERRLCVRRRTTGDDHRAFDRRAAFEARAAAEGYELVDPQALSIRDQMALFRSAGVVIGEYGSGLHNSVFSAPGTLFGVLNAPGVEQTRLCAAFRQPIVFMPSSNRTGHWSLSDQELDSFFATVAEAHGDPPPRPHSPAGCCPSLSATAPSAASASRRRMQLQGHIFTAQTIYGTVLTANFAARELIHVDKAGPDRPLALVYVPTISPFAFILADNPGLHPFAPRFREPSGPIIVTRRRLMPEGTVAFCDPLELTYLIAHTNGMAAFFGSDVGDWQHFKLTGPIERPLPTTIVHQITLVERVLATQPAHILDLLDSASPADREIIASLLTQTLLPNEAEVFVDHLLGDIVRIKALASLFPNDPWAKTALPGLRRFLRARRAGLSVLRSPVPPAHATQKSDSCRPAIMAIGREYDRLAVDGHNGTFGSLMHRCTAVARRAIPPLRDICIVGTARNEGLYLLEWVGYHRLIGVDRIFLYSNNNTDGSDLLLRALAAAGEVHLCENDVAPGGSPQGKAYGHALSILPDVLDYRWCAIIDVDEMIGFDADQFGGLKDYLEWQEQRPVDAVSLNWIMFYSSGALHWRDEPLSARFCSRAGPEPVVKTIFRPRLFHHSSPHVPIASGATLIHWRDAGGNLYPRGEPSAPTPRDTPAWISHYFFRSAEEFIWKWSRGRGDDPLEENLPAINVPEDFAGRFVGQHHSQAQVHDDRMRYCAVGLDDELARLRSLPGVAEALNLIRDHYRERSARLPGTLRALRETASPQQAALYDLVLAPEVSQ